MAKSNQNDENLVSIFVPMDPSSPEENSIPVIINGMATMVPVGQEVKVTPAVAEVIKRSQYMDRLANEYIKKVSNK